MNIKSTSADFKIGALASAVAMALSATPALAEEGDSARVVLEEITVTASRRIRLVEGMNAV